MRLWSLHRMWSLLWLIGKRSVYRLRLERKSLRSTWRLCSNYSQGNGGCLILKFLDRLGFFRMLWSRFYVILWDLIRLGLFCDYLLWRYFLLFFFGFRLIRSYYDYMILRILVRLEELELVLFFWMELFLGKVYRRF